MEPHVLDWSNRSYLIQEHIKNIEPDILGLCEIDAGAIHKFLSQSICSYGYKEYHKDNWKHGVSIFYKTEVFNLIEQNFYVYEKKQSKKKKKEEV